MSAPLSSRFWRSWLPFFSSNGHPQTGLYAVSVPWFPLTLFSLARHNPFIRALVVASLESARRLSPRRHRMSAAGSLALAAAMRVIHRIHRDATIVRHLPHPALATGFTQAHVFVF